MRLDRARWAGLTLVETLVVTAVILVLVALVSPIIGASKGRAKISVSLSNMRQLGQAAAMYEQATGAWALRTKDLVDAGYVPTDICSAPQDSTDRGWANEWVEHLAQQLPDYHALVTPYRNSYLGLGDLGYGLPYYLDKLREPECSATGWLVDLSEGKPVDSRAPSGFWVGPYRRLLFDTAVIRRVHKKVWTPQGMADHPLLMYLDADDKWKQELCN